ncbi:MAG: peptide chain release factor 1 [Candidatus Fermentibacteraceae bacterium]|nr:peptide chain release factor 1 [Candidatus Fermentibacteraceae bacterium]MBN2608177.1 peptide chain release factor 1 [Candidatus Fermentibacteraceae bacterium]
MKLDDIRSMEQRLGEIDEELCSPRTLKNPSLIRSLTEERAGLARILDTVREIREIGSSLEEMRQFTGDEDQELASMASGEIPLLENRLAALEHRMKTLLIPPDPNDRRDVIIEIRSGTGGEEAALFAADVYRMYTNYAQKMGWSHEVFSSSESERGGFKEITFSLRGQGVYSRMKFEAGVHRVQRVPETETSGRIHTSACTVAVLPEAEEVEIDINPEELRIDVFRSSGPGGQSVNTTDSAVRITHLPTGLVVSCQDEKSQHKNRMKAMKVLRSRLLALAQEEELSKRAQARKSMVGSGDRSAKIRTYNFPQGRVTDHRIHLSLHSLRDILGGDLDQVIDPLIEAEQERLLAEVSSAGE